ncbi:H-NS histone family protein [Salipiger sp. IMCC34102]|uniref:H-NS histone family protein n=1 Tax=Salipiger sp. IMCC34102 TaxID=2510647 RepID=UPI00101B769F|nr:H-NS histone family protein [Salipiger sp. IMCC34102]RYH00729.1 H-NS histone family protein [Salipiger sp. IMCC34102]
MTNIDLDSMSLEELKALQKDVNKAVDGFEGKRRKEALAAVEAAARENGFTLAELTGQPSKKSKLVSPPKYVHPENPEMTWTGRGRQPEWMKDAIENGRSKDEFLIK